MTGWLAATLLGLHLVQAAPATWRDRIDVGGEIRMLLDAVPRQDATEWRSELVLETSLSVNPSVRLQGDLVVAALAARRAGQTRTDLVVRPRDVWVEVAGRHADVRAGFGQLTWGRLDELQPTDVINPLDASRFLLEGRPAARLPVGFVRSRVFLAGDVVLEGVLVPWFRPGRFDELDEDHSPFNLVRAQLVVPGAPAATAELERREPGARWQNVSGGGRLSATVRRVDFSVMAFRGFDPFGPVVFEPLPPSSTPVPGFPGRFVERHERFTMVGADFETVVGDWAWRGEAAAFRRRLAAVSRPGLVDGHVVELGLGVDRRVGGARAYGAVFARREWSDEDAAITRSDVSLIGSIDRTLGRDRVLVRVFGLANPADRSGFLRGLVTWRLLDDVVMDLSAGAFLGDGDDTVGRFDDRDFLFARLRYYF